MSEKTVSELYREHVDELLRRALDGDEFSIKSLCCLSLAIEGFPTDDGGGNVIDLSDYNTKRLAA